MNEKIRNLLKEIKEEIKEEESLPNYDGLWFLCAHEPIAINSEIENSFGKILKDPVTEENKLIYYEKWYDYLTEVTRNLYDIKPENEKIVLREYIKDLIEYEDRQELQELYVKSEDMDFLDIINELETNYDFEICDMKTVNKVLGVFFSKEEAKNYIRIQRYNLPSFISLVKEKPLLTYSEKYSNIYKLIMLLMED